jgi:hypothetical protein
MSHLACHVICDAGWLSQVSQFFLHCDFQAAGTWNGIDRQGALLRWRYPREVPQHSLTLCPRLLLKLCTVHRQAAMVSGVDAVEAGLEWLQSGKGTGPRLQRHHLNPCMRCTGKLLPSPKWLSVAVASHLSLFRRSIRAETNSPPALPDNAPGCTFIVGTVLSLDGV